jgi:5S rRNA maturation endonuclease (ribonuclease M5)
MFKIVKENIDIVEALSKEMGIDFKKIGEHTYAPIDEQCPFCGHKDCFRIKNDGENHFYHCFSCEAVGDVITFIEKSRNIKPVEAARALAKEWNVVLPNDYNPIQDIFNTAALYYHTCLKDTGNKPYAELNKLTPFEYQTQIRRHKAESIDHFKIGWSDGGLITYLRGIGFEDELITQSGLMNKKGKDFLPNKSFIYPHFVRGRVSHFTFKDPLKQNAYQLKSSNQLNGYIFYNSDSLGSNDTVAIVEGENDLISVHEAGWNKGLIATIGQLSGKQLDWLAETLAGKNVVTFFDADQAGDKYRQKIQLLRPKFSGLVQVKLSGVKDIDEYLVNGGKLEAAIAAHSISAEFEDLKEQEAITDEEKKTISKLNIAEKDGAYYKMKYKDGQPIPMKLSNFTIKLKNIYIKGQEREREVVIVREDGTKSLPVPVTSECKVSLKTFKSFIANAVDASFYGQESDLMVMWEYVYMKGQERLVYVPTKVGRLEEFKGWLFRDTFIMDTGVVIRPDEEGIIWFPGKTTGLKAMSLNISEDKGNSSIDIPSLISIESEDERSDLLRNLITNLCKNLGDVGMALTLMGWAKANVYSNAMFEKIGGFPFLFFWGKHGQGKTFIAKWISSIFNMDESGYATIPQFKTGVGFGRKIAYYASLPVIMDEIRADNSTTEQYGVFRTWYNRAGRLLGTKEGQNYKEQAVRSNFIFVGQDQFTDTAVRQRCIPIRIPISGREKEVSFRWIEQRRNMLSSIGYHWVLESTRTNMREISEQYERLDKQLVENGCESRSAKNWACIGIFAKSLCDEFMPEFNYYEYLFRVSRLNEEEEKGDDLLHQFFMGVEGLQVAENSPLSREHMRYENGRLYMWFEEIFNLVQRQNRGITRENFSNRAIREAIKEEPYFLEYTRREMGLNKSRRRVYILDLTHPETPQSLQNIGHNCAR